MKFYDRAINKKSHYYKEIYELAKQYRVRIYLQKCGETSDEEGGAFPATSKVFLSTTIYGKPSTIRDFLSGFFHELGHVLNFRNKKYYNYHNFHSKTRYTKERVRNWIYTGLKAERYTDKVAKKLMRKYFPEVPYLPGYNGKEGADWFSKYHLEDFRKFLRGEKTLND
jgi:hypothetical protein